MRTLTRLMVIVLVLCGPLRLACACQTVPAAEPAACPHCQPEEGPASPPPCRHCELRPAVLTVAETVPLDGPPAGQPEPAWQPAETSLPEMPPAPAACATDALFVLLQRLLL